MTNELLSEGEAAARLNIGRLALRRYVECGDLPGAGWEPRRHPGSFVTTWELRVPSDAVERLRERVYERRRHVVGPRRTRRTRRRERAQGALRRRFARRGVLRRYRARARAGRRGGGRVIPASSLSFRHEFTSLAGVVERNVYFVRRYIWWDIAYFVWAVANALTVVFIADGVEATGGRVDVERLTATLLIGAVVWAYLGVLFEILTETVAWERWEGTIEYTFMAPLSRPTHLFGMGVFAVLYALVRAIFLFAVRRGLLPARAARGRRMPIRSARSSASARSCVQRRMVASCVARISRMNAG